jgi:hypothetical protein
VFQWPAGRADSQKGNLHVLEGPADSAGGLLNSTAVAFVSSRDLVEARMVRLART